ncbi:MAG: SUMF1/EgtB/PvdO family nonheme iron enzyme [Pseudomonadota bacterium]
MADGASAAEFEDEEVARLLGDELERLFDRLDEAGLLVGPRERSAAYAIAFQWLGGTRAPPARASEAMWRLRPMLAPVLARTQNDRAVFFHVFDTNYEPQPINPPDEPDPPLKGWPWRRIVLGIAATIMLSGLASVVYHRTQNEADVVVVEDGPSGVAKIEPIQTDGDAPVATERRAAPLADQTANDFLNRIRDAATAIDGDVYRYGLAPTLEEVAKELIDDSRSLRNATPADGGGVALSSQTTILAGGVLSGAAFSNDETRILSWSSDNTVRLWDAQTGDQIGPSMQHNFIVRGAVFSKDDTRILSWSVDNTVRLWDAQTGDQIGPSMQHEDAVGGAAFSNDETRILSWSDDATVRLWNAQTGNQIGTLMGHGRDVYGAAFSKDETRILSWSRDATVRLWDAQTGDQIGPSLQHEHVVLGAAFSKDETRILSWSDDATVRLWDANTGDQIGRPMVHKGRVSGAALSKDESRILTWSEDGRISSWSDPGASLDAEWSADAYARRLSDLTGLPGGAPLSIFANNGALWARLAHALSRMEQPGRETSLSQLRADAAKSLEDVQPSRVDRIAEKLRALDAPPTDRAALFDAVFALDEAAASDAPSIDQNIGFGPASDVLRAAAIAGLDAARYGDPPWLNLKPPARPAASPAPAWLWPLSVLIPLAFAFWVASSLALKRAYLRRRAPRVPPLHTKFVSEAGRNVAYQAGLFQRAAQQLLTRTPRASAAIDIPATVSATLAEGGEIIAPVFKDARLRPEYLVLIEANAAGDQEARRLRRMAERLEDIVDLDVFYYQTDPGELESEDGANRITIEQAQSRYPDHRLIILGTGGGFLDAVDLSLRPPAQKLFYWERRALLTPIPLAEWSKEDYALAKALEMPIGRATPEGLLTLAELLGLEGAEAGTEPNPSGDGLARPLPDLFRNRSQRFLFNAPPDQATIADLLRELRNYLDPSAFDWFASLAVYPNVQWDLTLLLGVKLPRAPGEDFATNPLYDERRLAAITQLPWLRSGRMPNWLRRTLISKLSPERREEIKAVLDELLENARPKNKHEVDAIELSIRRDKPKDTTRTDRLLDDEVLLDFLASGQREDFALARFSRFAELFDRGFWDRIGGPEGVAGAAALAFSLTAFVVTPRAADGAVVTGAYAPLWLLGVGGLLVFAFWKPDIAAARLGAAFERAAPGALALFLATLGPLAAAYVSARSGVDPLSIVATSNTTSFWIWGAYIAQFGLLVGGLWVSRSICTRFGLRIYVAASLPDWAELSIKAAGLGAFALAITALAGNVPGLAEFSRSPLVDPDQLDASAMLWLGGCLAVFLLGWLAAQFAPDMQTIRAASAGRSAKPALFAIVARALAALVPVVASLAAYWHVSLTSSRSDLAMDETVFRPALTAISPDGETLAAVDIAGRLVVSHANAAAPYRADPTQLSDARAPFTALAVGGEGEAVIAFADADGRVFEATPYRDAVAPVVDPSENSGRARSDGAPAQLAFGPNAQLWTAIETAEVGVRVITAGRAWNDAEQSGPPQALIAVSGGRAALATLDGRIRLVTPTSDGLAVQLIGASGSLAPSRQLSFDPDTMTLRAGLIDGEIWEANLVDSGASFEFVGRANAMALGPAPLYTTSSEISPFVGPATPSGRRLALVIGNAEYEQLPDLKNPLNDARLISESLESLGFEVSRLQNASRNEMLQAVRQHAQNVAAAGRNSVSFVYFGGQGVEIDGQNYLIPTDLSAHEPATVRSDSLLLNDVISEIDTVGPAASLFVLDTCRNDPFSGQRGSIGQGFAPANAPTNTFIAFAVEPGGIALDSLDARDNNSPYTSTLAETLLIPGLSVQDAFAEVRRKVTAATSGEQVPWISDRLASEFCFAGCEVQTPEPAAIPSALPPRLYIQIASEAQREDALRVREALSPLDVDVPEFEVRSASMPDRGEFRYFRRSEEGLARETYNALPDLDAGGAAFVYVSGYEDSEDIRDNHFELWLPGPTMLEDDFQPGFEFRDVIEGAPEIATPEMVVIPSGRFLMGSPASEAARDDDEGPVRTVRIDYQFAVGKYEVTWAEWEACVADGACDDAGPVGADGDEGWGRGSRPVINVDWNDAQAYVRWLSRKTGKTYRLLSEAEWEYAARGVTTTEAVSTRFSWGDEDPVCERGAPNGAVFSRCEGGGTRPVGFSAPNAFGLYDMHGNVWEWVEDCWNDSYSGAPSNGSAWTRGGCSRRVLRGGSWGNDPQLLRSADRLRSTTANRLDYVGFRVARTL